ncbi:MAG: hypothetical protein JW943_09710 [Deltaproteobacteria bacterium]|nr:hypothetical protein [Deltaproteobacteria bacterium]
MHYQISTTNDYHLQDIKTLGWELTVCNALDSPDSPCRKFLKEPDSYGHLLYRHLERFIPMKRIRNIIEVGGGYGCLMRDFLRSRPDMKATMLDISPFLLEKQRECLKDNAVDYVRLDFLEAEPSFLQGFDLAVFNENLGDFPTVLDVGTDMLRKNSGDLPEPALKIRECFTRYGFKIPEQKHFNFNIGAVDALEKICSAAIPYIFLSEHSCEASVPAALKTSLQIDSSGNPERIALKGHDEYTIRFSHLGDVAKYHGYDVIRGQMADFILPDFSDRVMAALRSTISATDEYEIIRQFIYDLYKYEYLILIRKGEAI